jgi:hypothetical protein
MTQCAQHMFVLISQGLPETTTPHFRMQVCGTLVKIFTMIEPLESLLQPISRATLRPPQSTSSLHRRRRTARKCGRCFPSRITSR